MLKLPSPDVSTCIRKFSSIQTVFRRDAGWIFSMSLFVENMLQLSESLPLRSIVAAN